LITTRAVNEMVDLEGSTFVFGFVRDFGVSAESVVRAWVVADDILSIRQRSQELKEMPAIPAAGNELSAFLALEQASRGATRWALNQLDPGAAIGEAIARYKPGFESLCEQFEDMLVDGERVRFERIYRELRNSVANGEIAHALARLAFADHVLDVLSLADQRSVEPVRTALAYFGLTAEIDFATLDEALQSVGVEDRWERRAAQELGAELRAARIDLSCAVLDEAGTSVQEGIENLKRMRRDRFADVRRLFEDLKLTPSRGLSAIHVVIRALSRPAANHP
jgi:glutamate dehydrogenase